MSIPDFQTIMLPLLETLSDGKVSAIRDVTNKLATHFKLTDEERSQLLPSGQQTVFSNRVAGAKADLKMAGLIKSPSRGSVQISEDGVKALAQKPKRIDRPFLRQYPAYLAFFTKKSSPAQSTTSELTPEDQLESL
jgi:restriction system protein